MTPIQFYSNINEKHVGKATRKMYLLTLKEQDKTKMELPFDMVSISVSVCRTKPKDFGFTEELCRGGASLMLGKYLLGSPFEIYYSYFLL